ncbi:hypothetical protein [Methanosphaera sp. WGK6]|uniref:hypothetical protein n=1 Tax=Methanosphaera sp. WGK6 TaxID=1561964 RepID=UPI00084BCF52|nr:hypothetical protein [Methanosphaera sp. WGK6]OED30136.1 hypothetical protein NL43_04325 [Methanosphaera sp. WGK6]
MSEEYEIEVMMKNEPGVIKIDILSDEIKKNILLYEMKRLDELVPFINKGMEDAFEEQEALLIIKDNDKAKQRDVEHSDESTFTLRTENGDIIGELIYDEEELAELREDPTVQFLSDNFVAYNNAIPGQKQFFVMEGEKSQFITNQDIDSTVKKLIVAIPSTETDHYIKEIYNIPPEKHVGTVIIGFTPFD